MSGVKIIIPILLVLLFVLTGCQQAPAPAATSTDPIADTAQEASPTAEPEVESSEAMESAPNESAPNESATTESAAIQDLTISAFEYRYEGPESIEAGLTRITLDNQGEFPHQLLLTKLDEGKTMDDVIASIEAGEDAPEWVTMYGGILADPGASSSYIANLTPGEYVYFSFWSEEDMDPPDAALGMLASLTVTEGAAETADALPEAALQITTQDFAFTLSGPVQSGEQLIQVNNEGQEPHHLIVFRLNEDATFEDFHHYFSSEEPQGPPPADIYGFLGEHSPGIDAYYTLNFEPGVYAFICFLPSMAHEGAPHFALGMMQEVVVE
jgi:hypothetical protein